MIYNNKNNYFNVSFSLYSIPHIYSNNLNIFPVVNKHIYCTLSMIANNLKTNMIIDNETASYSSINTPLIVFYIVRGIDISDENDLNLPSINNPLKGKINNYKLYNKLNIMLNDKEYVYVDVLDDNKNVVFATDIINILRYNPYLNLFYKKINTDLIENWISNDDLIEVFYLDDESNLQSVYSIIKNDNSLNYNVKTTYFKEQIMDILDNIYKDKLILDGTEVYSYNYAH